MIKAWYYHPAKWWQIWYPQHGLVGGCICGTVVGLTLGWVLG